MNKAEALQYVKAAWGTLAWVTDLDERGNCTVASDPKCSVVGRGRGYEEAILDAEIKLEGIGK